MSRATAVMGDCGWHVNDVPDEYFRPVQPDALIDVAALDCDVRVFVEYGRTRRVDKNYDKFVRYEALLVVWWRATDLGCPSVVFVCQDAEHRRRFMLAADNELTGHLFARTQNGPEERYTARDRTLFVLESDFATADDCRRAAGAAATPRPAHESGDRPTRAPTGA